MEDQDKLLLFTVKKKSGNTYYTGTIIEETDKIYKVKTIYNEIAIVEKDYCTIKEKGVGNKRIVDNSNLKTKKE